MQIMLCIIIWRRGGATVVRLKEVGVGRGSKKEDNTVLDLLAVVPPRQTYQETVEESNKS